MIVGTGVDICEVQRIALSIARFGVRFLERDFTEPTMPPEPRYLPT